MARVTRTQGQNVLRLEKPVINAKKKIHFASKCAAGKNRARRKLRLAASHEENLSGFHLRFLPADW